MHKNLGARTWNMLGLLLFAGIVAAIFWEVLPWFLAFVAPDAMPYFPFGNRTVTLDNLLAAGSEITPHQLYWLIFHPLLANKLTYIVDTLLLTLAGVYYLRGCGARHASAWLGGLALGFSGYSFTLFSAGHRGYFHMFGCAVFAFGLLAKCFRERRLFHFAMLGCVVAWGLPYQADVLAMVVMLAGAYTLWLTFAPACDPATRFWQRIGCVYPRFLLSMSVALVIAWPGLKFVIGTEMRDRKETIEAATTTAAGPSAESPEKKRAQYIFATNWSLPPADIVEFIAPCLYGVDSFDQSHPYWGALGRPYGWQPGQRIMPNYRQHTVYLGAVQVCFALLALLAWWFWRRRELPDAATPAENDRLLADVPFWVGAGIFCLLLALGRYTPFYHLFYAIPYMDVVRCPVKFHHLVEICTALLFGIGVEVWFRAQEASQNSALQLKTRTGSNQMGGRTPASPSARELAHVSASGRNAPAKRTPDQPLPFGGALRVASIVAAVAAGLALLAAIGAEASTDAVSAWIVQVGIVSLAGSLAEYLVSNLARASFLFGIAAVLFWLGRRHAARLPAARLLAIALVLVVTTDLALVARRYVRPMNLAPFYEQNAVVKAILARSGTGVGVANLLTSNQTDRDWFSGALYHNGVRLVTPAADDTLSIEAQAAGALGRRSDSPFGRRPDIFWKTTQTRFVLSSWSALEPWVKARSLIPVLTFAADPKSGTLFEAQPAANTFLVAECAERLPEAYVRSAWRGGLDVTNQLTALSQPDWDPAKETITDAPVTAGGAGEARTIGQARVRCRRGSMFRFATQVQTDAPQAGLLVVDEPYAVDLVARVDGQAAPLRRVNALWCGVEVPAGSHAVAIQRRWSPFWPCVSSLAGLLMFLWGMVRWVRSGHRMRTNEQQPPWSPENDLR